MKKSFQSILATILLMGLLVACGSAPDLQASAPTAVSATSDGTATTGIVPTNAVAPTGAAPTIAPAPTAVAAVATAQPTTSASLTDTNAAKPDDKTQGRLRVSNCVFNGPRVDVLVNGKVAVNGGLAQANLGPLDASGYLYLVPGTYSVALVPTGQSIDKAMLGPMDVPVSAGHRYTVVMLGQADESSHKPLVIDETEAYQKAGVSINNSGEIAINNVKNATSLSFTQDDAGTKNVPYGEFAVAAMPAATFKDFKVTVNGTGIEDIEDNGAGFNLPASDQLDCFAGIYPNGHDVHTAATTSLLNVIDFLQAQSDALTKFGHPEWAYTSFLTALKSAGLTDTLATGGPYLVFAPQNQAFTSLPKDKLDALMGDPKALGDLVRRHIVEGFYPYGSLSRAPGLPGPDRTVTNMLGTPLVLKFTSINGQGIGDNGAIMVAHGTRINPVNKLLLDIK